jgi:hypothetical protein
MRLFSCRLAAVLPILTFCSVLALAQGTTGTAAMIAAASEVSPPGLSI